MTRAPITAFVLAATIAVAQQQPRFEVTSVRSFRPATGQRAVTEPSCANGRYVSSGPLTRVMLWAYGIEDFQLSNAPSWTQNYDEYFAIEARSEAPVTLAECKAMVQDMLADRFKLAAHREMRDIPIYALIIGKNGIKGMKLARATDEGLGGRITVNGSAIQGAPPAGVNGVSMEKLASILRGFIDISLPPGEQQRPVVDRTGLEGLYRFNLDFGMGVRGSPPPDGFSDAFPAVRQQLGLELAQRTEPYPVLVVDQVERPDPN